MTARKAAKEQVTSNRQQATVGAEQRGEGTRRGEGQPSTARRGRLRRAVDQTSAKPKNKKRDAKKKQLALSNQHSAKAKQRNRKITTQTRSTFVLPRARRTYFPQANGRIVKEIEFFSEPDNNTLELKFQDDTSLSFEFEPSFVWEAYFARWKAGEQRILHRWPPIHSQI